MLNISEQLEQAGKRGKGGQADGLLRQPKAVLRLLKGMLKARLQGRTTAASGPLEREGDHVLGDGYGHLP